MIRFSLIRFSVSTLVLLMVSAISVHATVITTGNVDPGGTGSQPDPWSIGPPGLLYVGKNAAGTLTVQAGSRVFNETTYIGRFVGAEGQAIVAGKNSQWKHSHFLYVGYYGNGTLNIEDGGAVSNPNGWGYVGYWHDSTSEVLVTGKNSQWAVGNQLHVAEYGVGTLNVADGGVVSNSAGHISQKSGSIGEVTVAGFGSQWNNSDPLYVGTAGTGTLNVTDGGVVSNTEGFVGYYSGSIGEAAVTGSGSRWNSSGSLYVGIAGTGTLNVADGGVVANRKGFIGYDSESTGEVTVTGIPVALR